MRTLLLTAILAFGIQSAFAAQVSTKSCDQKFETTERTGKDVKDVKKKTVKKKSVKQA